MKNLKALFTTRDAHFTDYTMKIFDEIVPALESVTTYLTDMDSLVAQGIITWEDITIVEDVLVFLGSVNYEPGTVITIGDVDYPITEENVEDFQHIVHMSVPYVLAEEGDAEKILDHLYAAGGDKDVTEYIEAIMPETAKLRLSTEPSSEFDLSELSEEQLQSLKLSTTTKGGN